MYYQVYVLKLENSKYFVGHTKTTKNLPGQIEKLNIAWLKKNPYIKILKIYNNCDKFDVDKYTKKYMELYGIENVRGGSYYHMKLHQNILKQLEKEFEQKEIYEHPEEEVEHYEKEYIEDSFDRLEGEFEIINKCSRCGSNEHYAYQCFVEFELENNIKRCRKCKEYGHIKAECPVTRQQKILEQFQKLDNKIMKLVNLIRGKTK